MKLMQRSDLKELIDYEGYPCISIYLPTAVKGQETREGSIRFKNLVRESIRQLKQQDTKSLERLTREYEQAFRLIADAPFWLRQNEGLAVFIAPSFFRYYRVGVRLPQFLDINRHFFIKPMVPVFSYDRRFYLLALSLKNIRFFEIHNESIFERKLPGLPKTIDERMQYEDLERQAQFRSVGVGKAEGAGTVFHGQGNMADDKNRKKIIEQFLKQVVRSLEESLRDDPTRVILAADPYIQSVVQGSHPRFSLISEPTIENPAHLKSEELLERARKVIQSYNDLQTRDLVRQFADLLGTNKAAMETWDVLTAAWMGKVQILLVDPEESIWGKYAPARGQVELHSVREPGDEDLTEAAVQQTLRHDGMIYSIPKRTIPDRRVMAALLRY